MILFIEDDIMLSEEISEFLKENDFEVEVVGNGDDALKLLQSRIYDLCILDIGLPDCSGFLLCKKIRQFYRNPIIIFTAYENEEDIVTGLMAGADDYVTKPCSLRVLRSRIFSQLRRKQWSEEIETEIIRSGDLVIDVVHNMIFKKGRRIPFVLYACKKRWKNYAKGIVARTFMGYG